MYFNDVEEATDASGSRAEQWRNYMQSKKAKLQHQVNVADRHDTASNIFGGISIFVNGYTDPPAAELRRLIQLHGGEFHIYYKHGVTTYTVATHIATGKVKKLRKEEKIIHPKWIIDSIKAGTQLREDNYLLYKNAELQTSVAKRFAFGASTSSKVAQTAANDPNFVNNFYERSRLHLISTLAQEMKHYVNDLKNAKQPLSFPSRVNLQHLVDKNNENTPNETICHIDLDCFFVSVALRSRPELIGKPVAITHSKGTEGAGMSEIASCSYEARAQGVRNGCFIKDAKKTCPDLICLPYQFDDYRQVSKEIYSIISGYTLDIRAVSCDELYADLGNMCKIMHITDVMGVVAVIRSEILTKTGCNASVGVGNTMLIARIATRHAKPNGQFLIKMSDIEEFIKKEKISSLPGIGYNICAKLKATFGEISSCEDLQKISASRLKSLLGEKMGLQLYNMCRGIDKERNFLEKVTRKSISCDINYGIRFTKEDEVIDFLGKMCTELERKLDIARMTTSSVTLKLLIRAADAPVITEKYLGCGRCDAITKTSHLAGVTANKAVLHAEVKKLIRSINPVICDLRGIGIQLTHLKEIPSEINNGDCGYRNTLTQFFTVKSRIPQYAKRITTGKNDEDIAYDSALKKCREDMGRKFPYHKKTVRPDYRNYFDNEDVKAEFIRVLQDVEYPTAEIVAEMAKYFSLLVKNGDLEDVLSHLKFLAREAAELSFEWMLVVSALKSAVNHFSDVIYGFILFP